MVSLVNGSVMSLYPRLFALARTLAARFRDRRTMARLAAKLGPDHFRRLDDPAAARRLFKDTVNHIELELFSYCNRTCSFCPNSRIDRRSANNHMDPALYGKILEDLASIDYAGMINFVRYNEPLADRIILERLAQARAALPRALLSTHTNGDYLDRDYLEELYAAGLRRLKIQVYLGPDDPFDDARMLARMRRKTDQLRVRSVLWRRLPGQAYTARLFFRDMDLSLMATNWNDVGYDRGGLVGVPHDHPRVSPCTFMMEKLFIDWNGAVVPCCNIRSDAPEHAAYVVDTLSPDRSLFQAYAASPLVEWRRDLIGWGAKQSPCDTCTLEELSDRPALRRSSETISAHIPPHA